MPKAKCISNKGFSASLVLGKSYDVMDDNDPRVELCGLLRIVDESGESYLYLATMFEQENALV